MNSPNPLGLGPSKLHPLSANLPAGPGLLVPEYEEDCRARIILAKIFFNEEAEAAGFLRSGRWKWSAKPKPFMLRELKGSLLKPGMPNPTVLEKPPVLLLGRPLLMLR